MATPPSSITTVKGRRCTRSRARTATATASAIPAPIAPQFSPLAAAAPTAQQPSFVVFSNFPTSTAVQQVPQVLTGAAEPPAPPPSFSPTPNATSEPLAAAPTTDVSVTSATDATTVQSTITSTTDAIPTSTVSMTTSPPRTSEQTTPPANLLPSGPIIAGLGQPANGVSSLAGLSSPIATITSPSPMSSTSTSSDTVAVAVPTLSSDTDLFIPPPSTTSAPSISQSPSDAFPNQPDQTNSVPLPSSLVTSITEQPQKTTPTAFPLPSGAPAGIIAPDQGPDSNTALTQHSKSDANIGSIVGGIIGGIAVLALISFLLFLCMRKRKSRASTWDEKKWSGSGIIEKLNTVRTGADVFFAKIKGRKAGPMGNPYQRHTAQMSVSSTYSVHSNGRGRSTSESQATFAAQQRGSIKNVSSQDWGKDLTRKKTNSVSFTYRFLGTGEDPTFQSQNMDLTPYADQETPRNLQLLNPDPNSGPVTPQPAIASTRLSRDAFSLMLDQIEDVPDWLRETTPGPNRIRTQSPVSAMRFHLPSSSKFRDNDPFKDPSNAPSMPTQAVFLDQKRQSLVAYPAYNISSNTASRESQFTFFGEPGPSRPGTNLFTPGLLTGRTVRQSDPFDLDRPEVLALGNVLGNRQMQASVTRQPTRGRRTSSAVEGPYKL